MVVHKFTNALIHETSPYLLQHAHNPVNWLPWSQEAFRLAKTQDKPIFLSIGYSTCHWCHVMEHESFENEKIAQIMNEHFVNIKVDREERPDVDKVYMNYVQAITGGGGWPLNVFLTPELSPFFGGTYFPPNDSMYGRGSAGFPSVLLRIAQLWRTDRKHVEESSQRVIDALREATSGGGRGGASSSDSAVSGEDEKNWLSTIESSRVFKSAIDQFLSTFDRVYGGFGPAPKFPRPVIFNFLFRMCHRCSSQQQSQSQSSSYSLPQQLTQVIEHCCLFTLEKMALGGMYDQLASGFHRYSVDREWHVPHFEKMIYDQAQLISSFVEACHVSSNKKNFFEHVARQVIEYMKRDMMLQLPQSSSSSSSSPSSGAESMAAFYSAEDADSYPTFQEQDSHGKKREGAFYAWSYAELKKLLEGEPIVVTESSPSSSTKQGVTSGSGRSSHSSNLFDLFSFVFNIKQNGNVSPSSDPHGELRGLNILTQLGSAHDDSSSLMDDALEVFSKRDPSIRTVQQLESAIDRAKCILLRERDHTRPRPHLDDKIIVSWNALMISALARASQVLQVEGAEYAQLSEQVARFIRTTLYNGEQKTLYRTCRYSKSEQRALMPASGMIEGFLSDYCFMVCGLLDLYEATGCIEWLQWAIELQQRQDELFLDNVNGGYYEVTGHDESILLRMKEDYDGAEPSGNSTSAMNLLRLSQYRSEVANDLLTVADRLFRSERTMIREMPHAVPQLLCALDERLSPGPHIAIVYSDATGGWASLAEMRKTIFARHMPSKTVFYMNVDDQTVMDFVRCNMPYLTDAQVKDGLPTAYVCQNFSCQAPVTDVSKLAQMLHGC